MVGKASLVETRRIGGLGRRRFVQGVAAAGTLTGLGALRPGGALAAPGPVPVLSGTGDGDLAPYALLAPHLGGTGRGNRAEVFTSRGRVVLCAEQGPFALALAAADASQRDAWRTAGAGHVGASDGWQDFARNGAMTWTHDRAGPGNVALMGRLRRRSVLALGFGSGQEAAATRGKVPPDVAGLRSAKFPNWRGGVRPRAGNRHCLPRRGHATPAGYRDLAPVRALRRAERMGGARSPPGGPGRQRQPWGACAFSCLLASLCR